MKTSLNLAIAGLLILLLAFMAIKAVSRHQSTTFAGPEFHSRNIEDTRAVYSKLSGYLIDVGFHESTSPSDLDSWAGVHSEGARRIWFEKNNGSQDAVFVYIDLDELAVRTSVKWAVYGMSRKAKASERSAYSLAFDLDRWFEDLPERNTLPENLRTKKRQYLQSHSAKNDES